MNQSLLLRNLFVRNHMKGSRVAVLFLALPLPVIAALFVFHLRGASRPAGGQVNLDNSSDSRGATDSPSPDARGQAITSLTLGPAALTGGDSSTATVTLRQPAPNGGAVVMLSNNNSAAARLPRSVTVAAGERSASFKINAGKVSAYTPVNVSASFEGRTQTDVLTLLPPARREWYAAPDGSANARGTIDSPWDLATALAGGPNGSQVKPGDTLWLRGGRYAGAHTSTLAGTPEAPVVVRALRDERAVLDRAGVGESKQPALKVKGAWVWFWGLEVTNSHEGRGRKSPYAGADEPWRGSGADVYAPHVKFINVVFHDNGHGVWDKQDGTEVSGCLFFYNGNNKREHALYTGNGGGATKYITDNIVFAQGGYGILAHSNSAKGAQRGLHVEGNVCFNNGALTADDQTTGNIQVGGVEGAPAARVVVRNNYVYASPDLAASKSNGIRLGYEDAGNADVRLLDNYVVARAALRLWWWQSIECQGNTIYSRGESVELKTPKGVSTSAYLWDFNTYLEGRAGGPLMSKDSDSYDFSGWQRATALDAHSRVLRSETLRPAGVHVFLRPNRYEAGRAHVIVYNWDMREHVAVDLSSVLTPGATFEARDAQDYFGEPAARGTYEGAPLLLPLKPRKVTPTVGAPERAPSHTGPEFVVFVIKQTAPPSARKSNSHAR